MSSHLYVLIQYSQIDETKIGTDRSMVRTFKAAAVLFTRRFVGGLGGDLGAVLPPCGGCGGRGAGCGAGCGDGCGAGCGVGCGGAADAIEYGEVKGEFYGLQFGLYI